jgi:transposase-like protein
MTKGPRVFTPEQKVATVKRMLAGEDVSALSRELKIRRAIFYRWKDSYRKGGAAAFRLKRGRPPKPAPTVEASSKASLDLASATRRIAELERKIGQQELELDFFQRALRQVADERRPNGGRGARPSTSSSKR